MNSIDTIRELLGWCTVINIGVLAFSTVVLMLAGGAIRKFHAGLFGLSEEDLSRAYFQYLAQYKIAVWIFNITPYFAVVLIGG